MARYPVLGTQYGAGFVELPDPELGPLELCVETRTVVEGVPFVLPAGAAIVGSEPVHWSMDGKTRKRIVFVVRSDTKPQG